MKKLSTLLARRQALLNEARRANLAFAYHILSDFAQRAARAQLTGRVNVKDVAPNVERYWPSLTALDGNQSVIEEHFTDQDVMDLAGVVAFVTCSEALDLTFRVEDTVEAFVLPLRQELEREGIVIDQRGSPAIEERRRS